MLAHCGHPVAPASQDLVDIALMAHIKKNLIFWGFENSVKCNRQFHDT